MAKIKYKNLSSEMIRLTKPNSELEGRSSIGLENQVGEYYHLPIQKIKPYEHQARKRFSEEELNQLAETIKEFGIRQPISVIPSSKGDFYEVISGERRLRAAIIANLEKIPCFIIKDKRHVEEVSLIENIQREDLHPLELGDAYARILEDKDHGKIKLLSERIGKPKSMISEYVKFSKLPQEIKTYLVEKNIRSRVILRKLVALSSLREMKIFLGIEGPVKKYSFKNIMRIYYDNGIFKFENSQIKKLDPEELKKLKKALVNFLRAL